MWLGDGDEGEKSKIRVFQLLWWSGEHACSSIFTQLDFQESSNAKTGWYKNLEISVYQASTW